MLSDRQSLRCAVKQKIVDTPTSEKIPNLYPHRALNQKNTVREHRQVFEILQALIQVLQIQEGTHGKLGTKNLSEHGHVFQNLKDPILDSSNKPRLQCKKARTRRVSFALLISTIENRLK